MTFTRPALVLIALGLAGAAYAFRPHSGQSRRSQERRVRNAGPEEMTLPMRRWDLVDEMADESFPASDPPSTY